MFVEETLANKLNSREISVSLLILACTIDGKVEEKENKATNVKVIEEEKRKIKSVKDKNIKKDNNELEDVDIELEYDMSKESGFFEIRWE